MIETMEQRTQVGGDRAVGREFVQNVGLDFHELNDGIAAETAPVQNEGRVVDGRRRHWHGNLVPTGDNLAPVAEAHEFVHALDGLKFCFEPAVPVAPGIFVEAGFGEMAADAVVDLPGDELGMLAQGLSHGGDDAFGMVPIGFGIEANGAASAFVANQATFVNRQNFGMFLSEPNGRCGSGSGKNDLDPGPERMSITRPSQLKSHLVSSGSQMPQVNSPMRTTLMPAEAINCASRSHADSGLSAAPP